MMPTPTPTPKPASAPAPHSLDPQDWPAFRAQSHQMLDDMLDHLQRLRAEAAQMPVWQPIPEQARARFKTALPYAPGDLAQAHQQFMQDILPYTAHNAHPAFMGWVQGGGTPIGMVAEMLAAGLNANLGGRDQMPLEVERQIVHWMRELFAFPASANGLFVTGTSMANLLSVLIAKTAVLGSATRQIGLRETPQQATPPSAQLVAYTSVAAHGCIAQAMDLSGLGKAALRCIPVNAQHQIDIGALQQAITADRQAGLRPFFIAANAGTVDIGAIDDLEAIADLAAREQVWFHVDGACAALGMMSPEIAPLLKGIQRADSLAFDFHKWGQVQYDAGFLLVRDGQHQLDAFAAPAAYLRRATRGLAAGSPWPCDLGPDLSRGFRALKTWFTLKVYGSDQLGQVMAETCRLARYLVTRIQDIPALELAAPVALNIVCFQYRPAPEVLVLQNEQLDQLNADIVADVHESGIAVPSLTTIDGRLVIRAAIVNHRTCAADVDAMLDAVLRFGAMRVAQCVG